MLPILFCFCADYKIKARHALLARTIGAKQEEEASLSASNTLVITATVCMIVFSILEIVFYRLYNRKVSKRLKGSAQCFKNYNQIACSFIHGRR